MSLSRGVVVLYILKLHGIVELQYMLGMPVETIRYFSFSSFKAVARPWNDCLPEKRYVMEDVQQQVGGAGAS
jgi:hypothetical protein